jgi:hypothetical protein
VLSTIRGNSDRIKETAKSGNEVFMQQDYQSPIGASHMKTMDLSFLYFYCIRNKYIR